MTNVTMRVEEVVDAVFAGGGNAGKHAGVKPRVSRPEDEDVTNSYPRNQSKRVIATGFMALGINFSMNSPFVGAGPRSGILATESSVEAERARSPEKLNNCKMEKEHLKELVLEKIAAMKAISTCLLEMKKKLVTIGIEKELLSNPNTELLACERWKGTKGTRMRDSFIETIPSMWLVIILRVQKALVLYFREKVFKHLSSSPELLKSRWRSGEDVMGVIVPREDGTLFAPANPF